MNCLRGDNHCFYQANIAVCGTSDKAEQEDNNQNFRDCIETRPKSKKKKYPKHWSQIKKQLKMKVETDAVFPTSIIGSKDRAHCPFSSE